MTNTTKAERNGERGLIVTRSFNAPARLVFKAWTTPDLLKTWWCPKSTGASLIGCEIDLRTGGSYRYEFSHPSSERTMAFFGQYLEVVPDAKIVWTNEESPDGAVSTLTLEEKDGRTLLTISEVYPSSEAVDEALQGAAEGMPEQFAQLDELLVTLGA
jgi:uncharacterized protein YndB with AHSA1/START domain